MVSQNRSAAQRWGGDSGLTLIELLISLLIIGFLLSSVAAVLITSVRASAAQERRVLASAAQSQLQEDFQAVPWELTGIYADELAALETQLESDPDLADAAVRFDFDVDPPTFDGRPIVVLIGPGCSNEQCDEREPQVPAPWSTPTVGVREYSVLQVVTWIDRSGDGVEDVKRLTSLIRWTSSGQDYEQVFESERAPTAIEAGDPTGVRTWFDLGPRNVVLDVDGVVPEDTIRAYVRFTEPMTSAELRVYRVAASSPPGGPTELELLTIPMLPGTAAPFGLSGWVDFSLTLPASFAEQPVRFPQGERQFRVIGHQAGETYTSSRNIAFSGGPFDDDPEDPFGGENSGTINDGAPPGDSDEEIAVPDEDVKVLDVVFNRTTVVRKNNSRQFRCPLTITAQVDGLTTADHSVIATAMSDAGPRQFELLPVPGPSVASSNQLFRYTLEANLTHGFQNVDSIKFLVRAFRAADSQEHTLDSDIEILLVQGGNVSC